MKEKFKNEEFTEILEEKIFNTAVYLLSTASLNIFSFLK